MKKLTALALAGVLCLGMSTVALAAPSVGPKDAITATAKNGASVNVNPEDVDDWFIRDPNGNVIGRRTTLRDSEWFKGWDSADEKDASTAIKESLKRASTSYESVLDDLRQSNDPRAAGVIETFEKQQATLKELSESEALIEVGILADLSVDWNDPANPVTTKEPLTVKFVLNDNFSDLKVGQKIRVIHQNEITGLWEIYDEQTVQYDSKTNQFYVTQDFTSLSPVAVLRITEDGTPTPVPVDPVDPADPIVKPDANGQITADQLAELIAQRLQTNNIKFDRTASNGKSSPKTGE